ncbi:MAG: YqgE/AlgH family protein, partial [Rhodobiaceae bacterium]
AMGFIVNRPTDGLTLGEIASNLPRSVSETGLRNLPVFVGGPVQPENGFVLYSTDTRLADEEPVSVTQSLDILVQAAEGKGPQHMRLVLGYAGWGPGQLEN